MVESAEEPVGISADLRAYIDGAVTGRMASAGDDRVARLDRQLAQTVARLTEIIDAARRDSIERAPVQVGALRAELHAALAARDSRLAAIEAVQGVEAASDEAITVRLTAVEHEVREGSPQLRPPLWTSMPSAPRCSPS